MNKIIITNIIILVVLVAVIAGGGYYYNQTANYVTTDNAQVQGDLVPVTAGSVGRLMTWTGTEGTTVSANQVIGTEDTGPTGNVVSPIAGTIVQSNAIQGEIVAPGQQLATVVNMNRLYVVANIDETAIDNVKVGQTVDITLDAFSGTLTGTVEQIGLATQSSFSLLPSSNTSGNYTKQTQRIPVRIRLQDYSSSLIPGLNASVRIHR